MKFNPRTHIIGKSYDMDQENMCAMIAEIERLREALALECYCEDIFDDGQSVCPPCSALNNPLSAPAGTTVCGHGTPTDRKCEYCEGCVR